jgi:hypothetical protein
MELEPPCPSRSLLEELCKRMPTWEATATTSRPSHWVIGIFPSIKAALQIYEEEKLSAKTRIGSKTGQGTDLNETKLRMLRSHLPFSLHYLLCQDGLSLLLSG